MKTLQTLILLIILTAGFVLLLPGCGIPVAIVVEGQHGTYGYSSKSGLSATIHAEK